MVTAAATAAADGGGRVAVHADGERAATPPEGGAGLTAAGGWESWEYGPYQRFPQRRQLVSEYYLMARYDPTVKTALTLLRTLILGRLGEYQHEDDAVRERVIELLGRIDGGVRNVVAQLTSAFWAGFAVPEVRWAADNREWWIDRCDLLHPLTFFNRHGYGTEGEQRTEGIALDPSTGRVETLTQWGGKEGRETRTLSREQVIYWPASRELREETYGVSLLQAARPAWFAKVKLSTYWNTFAEKIAMPTPVFSVPHVIVTHPRSQEQVSLASLIMEIYEGLKPGMAMAIPGGSDSEWRMDTLTPNSDGGEAFDRRVSYLDAELWLAALTPRMLMQEPEHGSRAQAATSLDLMLQLVDGIRQDIGGDNSGVLIEQLVRPLIRYNIGELEHYGTWAWQDLQDRDLERLARIFEAVERARAIASQNGGMDPADERVMREAFDELYASPEELERGMGGGTAVDTEHSRAAAARYG